MKAIKRLNKATSLEIILLAGFAVFFIRAAATGSVSLYVHPRVVPFIIFAAIAMLIIALVRVGDLLRSRHEGGRLFLLFSSSFRSRWH
jgi:putative membrane protein